MLLYDFESWFTLLTGFAIFVMGLRIFWLDAGNKMYRAFMLSTFFMFIQNILFFVMGQITDIAYASNLRPWQETSWNIAALFIGITMWYYAKQFIPRQLSKAENYWFYTALLISPIFIYLEAFTNYGYGELFLNSEQSWSIKMNQVYWYDYLRMLWTMLLYGVSMYFSYLPFKHAISRHSKQLRGVVFVVYSIIMLGTFTQNYILNIFFQTPALLNESINVAIGALFSGLMLANIQLNDLNSDYAIPNLLKTMTNWFVLTDKKLIIRRVNTAFLENMGKDLGYWQNQSISSLFENKSWDECQQKILSLGENQTMELEFEINKNGKIYYILFTITPVFSRLKLLKKNKVKAYAFVGTNLNQFKASENKTKAYAKKLETSVHALESFAFIASHDLKEPIRNIGSFTGLLKRRLGDLITPDISDYLGYIETSVKSMNELVNSIMTISGIGQEGVDFKLLDVKELILQKPCPLTTLFEKRNVQLKVESLPPIHGDYQLLKQLFQNLLENSIKYNTSEKPDINIYSTLSADGNNILIKIEDNGIGIELEYREQVFQMFKRLHSRKTYEGTGIGLAICKRIMELHGGKISIEDAEKNTGVAFVLSFPK